MTSIELPPIVIRQLQQGLTQRAGTYELNADGIEEIFKLDDFPIIFFRLVDKDKKTGTRLGLDRDGNLNYVYHSPGTRTQVAKLSLKKFEGCGDFIFGISWSPELIRLKVICKVEPGKVTEAVGGLSLDQWHIDDTGFVMETFSHGSLVKHVNISMSVNGNQTYTPSAAESWKDIKTAIQVLLDAKSDSGGSVLPHVRTNLVLTILTTGFETYCKRRFLELEVSGITVNDEDLLKAADLFAKLTATQIDSIRNSAWQAGVTFADQAIRDRLISFQSYDTCKSLYKLHGINFGSLLQSSVLGDLKRYIRLRHRITHISPYIESIAEAAGPGLAPITDYDIFAERAVKTFEQFITALHEATLHI